MLTALRHEVRSVLDDMPISRRPALRRSDDPQALLATDIPCIDAGACTELFTARMKALGWRVWREGDWLLLDTDVPTPSYRAPATASGELGCCISLLSRHPGKDADAEVVRAILKAAESGPSALERLCKRLHGEWAAAIREHRNLPGGLMPYLCRAENQCHLMKEVAP